MLNRRAQVAMEYVLVLVGIILAIIIFVSQFLRPRIDRINQHGAEQAAQAVETQFLLNR